MAHIADAGVAHSVDSSAALERRIAGAVEDTVGDNRAHTAVHIAAAAGIVECDRMIVGSWDATRLCRS